VIACRVFMDMSDEEAELAALSENACRTHARPTDRLLQLRKWQELYMKLFPHLVGRRGAANSRWANSTKAEAKQRVIEEEKAQDAAADACEGHSGVRIDDAEVSVEVEIASEATEAEPAKKIQTFRQRVSDLTGTPTRTLDRDLKIVNNLDEEQVSVLEAVACTKMGMLKIIDATDDAGKRGEIVALVASGKEVEQAIKEVVGTTTTKDEAGRVKEAGEGKSEEPPVLSDEEWFDRECGEFAGFLVETDRYKSDAIIWRRIADERT